MTHPLAWLAPFSLAAIVLAPTHGLSATPPKAKAPAKMSSAIPVTADALMDDYSPHFMEGDEKWRGKTVEVTGFCLAPDPDQLAIWFVDPQYGILCLFPKTMGSRIKGLQNGQCVKVVGKVGYFTAGRVQIGCTSLSLCDSRPITLTTDSLFDEIKDNQKEVLEKYKDRALFVHGDLGSVVTQTGGVQRVILSLKTKGGEGVWCFLPSSTDEGASKLAEDHGVTVFGKVQGFTKINGEYRVKMNAYSYKADPK